LGEKLKNIPNPFRDLSCNLPNMTILGIRELAFFLSFINNVLFIPPRFCLEIDTTTGWDLPNPATGTMIIPIAIET
jgi:hypothetical protein